MKSNNTHSISLFHNIRQACHSSLVTRHLSAVLIIFFLLFFVRAGYSQNPWDRQDSDPEVGTQALLDTLDAREQAAKKKLSDAFDQWLITDLGKMSFNATKLVKYNAYLNFPAMNPQLGAAIDNFREQTGATIIFRSYVDVDFFNPWVVAVRATQKARKAFELSNAPEAHAIFDIVYKPTAINRYTVESYTIELRDSVRTEAFNNLFGEDDWKRMRDTIQNIMGQGPINTIDTVAFNNALDRGMQALIGNAGLQADPEYTVTFRQGSAPGYDAYKLPALQSYYLQGESGTLLPWISVDAKKTFSLTGRYRAGNPSAAREIPLVITADDLATGQPQVTDTIVTQNLMPSGKAGEFIAEASYTRSTRFNKEVKTIAGQVAVAVYEPLHKKVVIIQNPDADSRADLAEIRKALDEVYGQAIVEWEITEVTNFRYDYPSQLETGTSATSSYSSEMNAVISAYKKSGNEIDSKTCYIFMVPGFIGSATGFMPLKGQYGFVKSYSGYARTVAHELGHGAFRLRHTFSDKKFIAAQGTTDNIMDYGAGKKLYKFQWDLAHDPENMIFTFLEDDEEFMDMSKIIKNVNLTKYQNYAFLAPSGQAIIINGIKTGVFNEDGGLMGFTLTNNKFYGAAYLSESQNFIAYIESVYSDDLRGLITKEKQEFIEKNKFLDYSLAGLDDNVIAVSRLQQQDKYIPDCYCVFLWKNKRVSTEIGGTPVIPMISKDATLLQWVGSQCDDATGVYEGIGFDLYKALLPEIDETQKDSLKYLANYLTINISDKSFAIYDGNGIEFSGVHTGITNDIVKFFKDNELYSEDAFIEKFWFIPGTSNCDVIITPRNISLWDGIDRETYNTASVDWTSFDVPKITNEDELFAELGRLSYALEQVEELNILSEKSIENIIAYIDECYEDPDLALSQKLHVNETIKGLYVSLGYFGEYNYTFADLVVRQNYKKVDGNRLFSEILKREQTGEATALTTAATYEQYVAQYGTESAYFLGQQYEGMAGLMYTAYGIGKLVGSVGKPVLQSIKSIRSNLLPKVKNNVQKVMSFTVKAYLSPKNGTVTISQFNANNLKVAQIRYTSKGACFDKAVIDQSSIKINDASLSAEWQALKNATTNNAKGIAGEALVRKAIANSFDKVYLEADVKLSSNQGFDILIKHKAEFFHIEVKPINADGSIRLSSPNKGLQGSAQWNHNSLVETIQQNKTISSELKTYHDNGNTVKTIIVGYDRTNDILHIFNANY